ncbi:MAG: flagellar export protein FliJ [Lachnospiraceae bacterium]|nr:flagellar export protein FliJ [Lachnospiraceae bacterium]
MAKFFYKMQNILDIKEKLETQARNDYAVANAALAEEEDKLLALQRRRDEYELKLKDVCNGRLVLTDITEAADAVEIIKYHIRLQEVNVERARRQVDITRNKLQEAMQERKTHEKLKENAFEVFKQEVAASESKEIDELVSYRHGQKDEEAG